MTLSNRRKKEIASLAKKKYREQLGEVLVEGVRSVEAAVQAGAPLREVLLTEAAQAAPRTRALAQDAAAQGATVYTVAPEELAKVSDVETHQGVLAVAAARWQPVETLAAARTVLALDGLQDPGNAGTLLRTAAWFGVSAVLAGPGTVDLFNPKVVRAAMGGLWDVPLVRTDDLAATLRELRAQGFTCYGADLDGVDARTWQPVHPSVLVLGNEAHGLSEAASEALDARVRIAGSPRRAGTESLNVAAAGAVLLFAWHAR